MKNFWQIHRAMVIFFVVYVIVRFVFLNVNYTEWGDTFRMLRAAHYLSNLSWPFDEKRWPFYSILLVPGIWLNAPIIFGRILSVIVSAAFAVYVYFFYIKFINESKKQALFAVILSVTSSVYAYWSLRVMADPLFALLVLVFFYYFISRVQNSKIYVHILLSMLLFSITMTRLEGIFIVTSVLFTLIIKNKRLLSVIYLLPQILIYLPFTIYAKFIYSGPVNNDYLEEVKTFIFDTARFEYFFIYTIFILALPFSVYYLYQYIRTSYEDHRTLNSIFAIKLLPLYLFIFQEFVLGFIWTPSVPRVYVPVIGFINMFFVFEFYKTNMVNKTRLLVTSLIGLLLFIGIILHLKVINPGQYSFYFIAPVKLVFLFSIIVSITCVTLVIKKYRKENILYLVIATNIIVSSFTIYNQKDVYKSVSQAVEYIKAQNSDQIKVAYSDETGLFDYYDLADSRISAYHLDQRIKLSKVEQYSLLKQDKIKYLLWTNEFNRGSNFIDPIEDPRYKQVYESKVYINDLQSDIIYKLTGNFNEREYFISKVYLIK